MSTYLEAVNKAIGQLRKDLPELLKIAVQEHKGTDLLVETIRHTGGNQYKHYRLEDGYISHAESFRRYSKISWGSGPLPKHVDDLPYEKFAESLTREQLIKVAEKLKEFGM